jgi:hypothetical protein
MNRYITKTQNLHKTSPKHRTAVEVSASKPIQDIPRSRVIQAAAADHESIVKRAYQIYVEKGHPLGQNEQILEQAKREQWYKAVVEMRHSIRNNTQFHV